MTPSLVSEVKAIEPGVPFTVGLHLQHGAGHHSYWKYPGIVGIPTALKWVEIPKGFHAGKIQWEIPERVKMRGIGAYGYTRDTVLLIEIVPPESGIVPGDSILFRAQASWMSCSQRRCNPGFKDLELRLPVASTGATGDANALFDPKWHPVFEEVRARHAVPLHGCKVTATVDDKFLTLGISAESDEARRTLQQLKNPYFFSSNGLVASNEAQEWSRSENGLRFKLPRNRFGEKDPRALEGIVTAANGWSPMAPKASGISLHAPLRSASSP